MKIIISNNYQTMSAKAAKIVIREVNKNQRLVLGLASGRTPLGFYQRLRLAHKQGKVSFNNVIVFNLDEYIGLGKDYKNSYGYYLRHQFADKVGIKDSNLYLLNGRAKDLKKECQNYEAKIRKQNGIDWLILGIGKNGHIAFNEPGSSFRSITRVINLTYSSRLANAPYFNSLAKVPKRAITVGLGTIMRAKNIILMAAGKNKAEIIAQTLKSEKNRAVPASALQEHKNLIVILDKLAASCL